MSGPSPTPAPANAALVPQDVLSLSRRILNKVRGRSGFAALGSQPFPTETVQEGFRRGGDADSDDTQIELLAKGGYNDVWLVKSNKTSEPEAKYAQTLGTSFVLRMPNDESLKPHQIQNEVGWLSYMAEHCPDIPVPIVYDHSDGSNSSDLPSIGEQYIQAEALSEAWKS